MGLQVQRRPGANRKKTLFHEDFRTKVDMRNLVGGFRLPDTNTGYSSCNRYIIQIVEQLNTIFVYFRRRNLYGRAD